MSIINFVKNFANQEDGQDLLEYALLVALIALIAVAGVKLAGEKVDTVFKSVAGAIPVGS
jgi:pilus assembly protein Flp/PilA